MTPGPAPATRPRKKTNQPAKMNRRYWDIINWFITNPQSTVTECARVHGYSVPRLSVIINTDFFKEELAKRNREVAALVNRSVSSRLENLARLGIEDLEERVTDKNEVIPIESVTKIVEVATRGMGLGVPKAQPAVQNTFALSVDQNLLEEARKRYREQQGDTRHDPDTIEAAPEPSRPAQLPAPGPDPEREVLRPPRVD